MNPSILARYNRPVFFYFWSITIPWFCWFLAGYLSQLPQAADYAWLQGTLGRPACWRQLPSPPGFSPPTRCCSPT